jgi:hypothetical protein
VEASPAELWRPSEHEPLVAAEWDEAHVEEAMPRSSPTPRPRTRSSPGFSGVALFLRHLLDGEDSFPTMGPFGS